MDREGQQILPIIEEELRVGKRQVERGGVRVHAHMAERPVEKSVDLRQEVIRDTERHTEVDVERVFGTPGGTTFNTYDPDFRRHYETYFSRSNMPYERIQPAYRYGYTYGGRYQGRTWNEVEAEARRDWQQQNPDSKWEQFKDAVREGFERARR